MTITRVQTEALATLATKLRPDWRHAGVVAAIDKAADTTSDPFDIARALVNLASEGSVQTPALLAGPGPHWRNPDGSTPHRRGDNDVHCPEHPTQVHPCPVCKAEKPPLSDAAIAELRAVLMGRRTPKPKFISAASPATDLDTVRARIDAERSA
jgi:hypothetical protein